MTKIYDIERIAGHMIGYGKVARFHVVWQSGETSWEPASSFVFPGPNGAVHVNYIFEQYVMASDPVLKHVFRIAYDLARSEAEMIMFDMKKLASARRVTADHIVAMLSL